MALIACYVPASLRRQRRYRRDLTSGAARLPNESASPVTRHRQHRVGGMTSRCCRRLAEFQQPRLELCGGCLADEIALKLTKPGSEVPSGHEVDAFDLSEPIWQTMLLGAPEHHHRSDPDR